MAPLILASASPRRLALLAQIGVTPDEVVAPGIDEAPRRDELPRAYVQRMALGKMRRPTATTVSAASR